MNISGAKFSTKFIYYLNLFKSTDIQRHPQGILRDYKTFQKRKKQERIKKRMQQLVGLCDS